MRFNIYQNLNPVIKTLVGLILAIGLYTVSSLQLNAGILLFSILFLYIFVEEARKPVLLVCVLLFAFLISYGILTNTSIQYDFYIGDYNYGTMYRSLWFSSYVGVLFLTWEGIRYSVTALSFSEALHQTLHLPKKYTHKLYRILLFMEQYDTEAKTVQKVYKAKGITVSTKSFRVFNVVLRNMKRKLDEADLAMQAKGFEESTPSTHYTVYGVEILDALYLVLVVLGLALAYYYRIW